MKKSLFISYWLTPENSRDIKGYIGVRAFIGLLYFAVFCYFTSGWIYLYFDVEGFFGPAMLFAAMSAACFPVLKTNKGLYKSYALSFLTTCIALSYFLYHTGGLGSPNLVFIIITPIVGALFLGAKGIVISFATMLVMIAGFAYLHMSGIEFPQHFEGNFAAIQTSALIFASIQISGAFYYYIYSRDQAVKEVKLAQDQKKALISIMAHDINNPLSVIHSVLDQSVNPKTPKSEQFASRMMPKALQATEQIVSIINDARNLFAMQDFTSSLEPIDLGKTIGQSVGDVEMLASTKDINFNIQISKDLQPIAAIPRAIRQSVINNLLSNAIKFSPKGSIITIKAESTTRRTILTIKDQGEGIPDKFREHIFSLHVKTHKRGSQGEKGTGFGLPIVKAVLDICQATIVFRTKTIEEISSHESTGTQFALTFKNA